MFNGKKVIFSERIAIIYSVLEQQILKDAKANLRKTDAQWHLMYLSSLKQSLVASGGQTALHLKLQEEVVKDWLHGNYGVKPLKNETLTDYSQRLARQSFLYKSLVDDFKKQVLFNEIPKVMHSDHGNQLARSALNDIRVLIESTDWVLGAFGSRKKIDVNGKQIPIPAHAYKIYQCCLVMDDHNDLFPLFDKIHSISVTALKPQANSFFNCLRVRDQSTQDSYESIYCQSKRFSSLGIK